MTFEDKPTTCSTNPVRATLTLGCIALTALLLSAGCHRSSSNNRAVPLTVPSMTGTTFSDPTRIDNPYFPLTPGTVNTYVAESNGETELIIVETLHSTRLVMGVTCVVVRDRVYQDGLLIEDTHDWYAQDDLGNVWYMGEEVDDYEYDDDGNVLAVTHGGAWEAGKDVAGVGAIAQPGHLMRGLPLPGAGYHQEFYAGQAEDTGLVVALNVPVTLADGTTYYCLETRDATRLDPGADEFKYYAPGIGPVLEEKVSSNGRLEWKGSFRPGAVGVPDFSRATFSNPTEIDNSFLPLEPGITTNFLVELADGSETIVVEVLDTQRAVLGIACVEVRDRVFEDGVLIEDTLDWYAQDDDGNVWYMGEDVDNFHYDEDGNLVSTDHAGAWESGLDVAGVGELAEPGHLMRSTLLPGASYHQEFYGGEAEDMAAIVSLTARVELDDGSVFENCLQTLEWNPADPGALDHKFYARGIGVVFEQPLGHAERVELKGIFRTGRMAVPDFSAATFTNPSQIDNTFFSFPVGTVYNYTSETEDGAETITIEVMTQTRTVMGIACRAVRDQVHLEGVLIEDTEDWYAQDDDGNVWYMGEEVDNFEYDENGNLVGMNNDGAWESGLDVAGVGSIAEPGYVMKVALRRGDSYHQEFYEGAAEDAAYIVALGVDVELADGTTYANCVQTLDWNPLDPHGLEYKYYAPGVGLVLEEVLGVGETVELASVL